MCEMMVLEMKMKANSPICEKNLMSMASLSILKEHSHEESF